MKKITLALCACAFALTALFISCKNSVDYKDVSSYNSSYKYAVKGTMVSTEEQSYKSDSNGDPAANGKITSSKVVTDSTIDNGFVTVQWYTNENNESNYKSYDLSGNIFGTKKTTSTSVFYGDDNQNSEEETTSGRASFPNMTITEIDGDYYLNEGDKLTKLETLAISEDDDAFDGDFGKDFEFNFKQTKSLSTLEDIAKYLIKENYGNDGYSYTGDFKDTSVYAMAKAFVDAGGIITKTTEYKLKFTLVEDFDPNEADD